MGERNSQRHEIEDNDHDVEGIQLLEVLLHGAVSNNTKVILTALRHENRQQASHDRTVDVEDHEASGQGALHDILRDTHDTDGISVRARHLSGLERGLALGGGGAFGAAGDGESGHLDTLGSGGGAGGASIGSLTTCGGGLHKTVELAMSGKIERDTKIICLENTHKG